MTYLHRVLWLPFPGFTTDWTPLHRVAELNTRVESEKNEMEQTRHCQEESLHHKLVWRPQHKLMRPHSSPLAASNPLMGCSCPHPMAKLASAKLCWESLLEASPLCQAPSHATRCRRRNYLPFLTWSSHLQQTWKETFSWRTCPEHPQRCIFCPGHPPQFHADAIGTGAWCHRSWWWIWMVPSVLRVEGSLADNTNLSEVWRCCLCFWSMKKDCLFESERPWSLQKWQCCELKIMRDAGAKGQKLLCLKQQ